MSKRDADWMRESIDKIFGYGGQSVLARFMQEAGDTREYGTILRTINNAASGRNRLSGELRVLLTVLLSTERRVATMIERAINPVRPDHCR